jgi:Na+/melibiose symporter-like transporter
LFPSEADSAIFSAAALFIIFYFLERRRRQPLIKFALLRIRAFRVDAAILFCVQFSIAAMAVYGVLYVQRVLKFSPLESGAAQLAMEIPLLLVTQLAGRIFDRFGARRLVLSGMGLATTGCFGASGNADACLPVGELLSRVTRIHLL